MNRTLRRLGKVYDPLALCVGFRKLGFKPETCDHTFKGVRAVLARAAPDVDADAYIKLLEEAGQHCDCEVMYNICPDTGA